MVATAAAVATVHCAPAMVANSSCATDPQAHLPMLYYACYIRGSVVAAVALMPIHTFPTSRGTDGTSARPPIGTRKFA